MTAVCRHDLKYESHPNKVMAWCHVTLPASQNSNWFSWNRHFCSADFTPMFSLAKKSRHALILVYDY